MLKQWIFFSFLSWLKQRRFKPTRKILCSLLILLFVQFLAIAFNLLYYYLDLNAMLLTPCHRRLSFVVNNKSAWQEMSFKCKCLASILIFKWTISSVVRVNLFKGYWHLFIHFCYIVRLLKEKAKKFSLCLS